MKFDQYKRNAQVYPAVLSTIIPLAIFCYFLLSPELLEMLGWISGLAVATGAGGLTIVLTFLIIEVNRFLSKFLFEKKYFDDEYEFPSTRFLLFTDDEFSDVLKARVRRKIRNDFGLDLLDKNEEQQDPLQAKRLIIEAVPHIRNMTRDDSFISRANIRYGFFRNLVGGSIIGLVLSVLNAVALYSKDLQEWAIILNIVLSILYLIFLLMSKWILRLVAESYAKTLIVNYDGLSKVD